jgi:hypothetical protein
MRNINDFTIKEFKQFSEMLNEKEQDIFGIFELFGISHPEDLKIDKYNEIWKDIQSQTLSTKGVKTTYIINGKRLKPTLNILKLNAGQFIDFQNYMIDFKLEQVLSVFLLPQYKKGLHWQTRNYATDYDVIEIQNYLYENMKIGEANELSAFFLKNYIILLQTMKDCSERKLMKMKKEKIKDLNKLKIYK